MARFSFFTAVLAFSTGAMICSAAEKGANRVPVLLELFTSEGCSSCPPADRLLAIFDQQPIAGAELIVLSEHVDYWDHLGWRDPFSSSQYTARQQEYTNRYRLDGVYTPQLVVDGRFGLVGSDGRDASSAIQQALMEQKVPIAISDVAWNGNQVKARIELSAASQNFKSGRAVLYVALADNRAESQVGRGENAGRSLAHVAVTRVLRQFGTVDLDNAVVKEVTLTAQPAVGNNGSRLVALIQDRESGRILGVAEQKL